jgi:hypothetical protein
MPPRKRRQRGYIETLPSGSFRAVAYTGTDPLTRKPQYVRETVKTYDEAEKALSRLPDQGRPGAGPEVERHRPAGGAELDRARPDPDQPHLMQYLAEFRGYRLLIDLEEGVPLGDRATG